MKRLLFTAVLTLLLLLLGACYQVDGGILIRTADENLSIFVPVAPAEVGEAEPTPPALIKGNISTSTGEKIYHMPGQSNYDTVKIDEAAGERWFTTEDEAQAAGWRKARN